LAYQSYSVAYVKTRWLHDLNNLSQEMYLGS
jgi:hypothetical protein